MIDVVKPFPVVQKEDSDHVVEIIRGYCPVVPFAQRGHPLLSTLG